jgi:multidrug efflux pump subunit AcrA (membrane-fusion protein)
MADSPQNSDDSTLEEVPRKKLPTRVIVGIGLAFCAIAALVFFFVSQKTVHKNTPTHQKVDVKAQIGNITSTLGGSGAVISPLDRYFSPSVSEIVTSINVKEGMKVSEGMLLATLNNQTQSNALTLAKNNLNTQIVQLQNLQSAINSAQDTAASNALGYDTIVQNAKNALDAASATADLKASSYQNAIQVAQIALDTANANLAKYSTVYPTNGLDLSNCIALNAPTNVPLVYQPTCVGLYQNYLIYANAVSTVNTATVNLKTAKDNLAINTAADKQTIASLSITYQNAIYNKDSGSLKDQQAVQIATNNYKVLAAQFQVKVANPKPEDFGAAQAAIAKAQNDFDATFVRAPVSGQIASINSRLGQVSPNSNSNLATNGKPTGMFLITQIKKYQYRVKLSNTDGTLIKVGQIASVSFDTLPKITSSAKVSSILPSPPLDGVPPGINVTLEITSDQSELYPGLQGTLKVAVKIKDKVLILPNQAIFRDGLLFFVNLVENVDGKRVLKRTYITIGSKGEYSTEVTSGIKVGDVVEASF